MEACPNSISFRHGQIKLMDSKSSFIFLRFSFKMNRYLRVLLKSRFSIDQISDTNSFICEIIYIYRKLRPCFKQHFDESIFDSLLMTHFLTAFWHRTRCFFNSKTGVPKPYTYLLQNFREVPARLQVASGREFKYAEGVFWNKNPFFP